MTEIKKLLLLPHIKVQNANALSSPFTIGFPAMTAWLGAARALQRKLNQQKMEDIKFNSVAVISHHFDLQTHKGVGDYVHSIIGTGNPLEKDGKRSAFIEDARCHLDVSILIEFSGIDKDDEEILLETVEHIMNTQLKIAGGDILKFKSPECLRVEDGNNKDLAILNRKLMPGYTLIERRELIVDAMQQGQDAIDAILDYLKITHHCEQDENENITWTSHRKTTGWIVPIATGFHGITELGVAKNQRDSNTPHRFAESVVTLGEFVMPYRIKSLDDMLWHYHTDLDNNLYLCRQNNQI
ncbi:MAG: type I-F CRISPR-associated protein Csy2 [Methylococcales bacterium]|jgi:CRISPR-associated protein Csy2|nr:type I-F CRISPR-associated protein Csy2 [Methylococcales bacterium]